MTIQERQWCGTPKMVRNAKSAVPLVTQASSGSRSAAGRAKETAHRGGELGGPGRVHQVPGRDRDQPAVRDLRRHAGELILADVAVRAAGDDQGPGPEGNHRS